jgi:hypothetical protein
VIGFANLAMILYNVATISVSLYIDQTPSFYPSYMNQLCDGPVPRSDGADRPPGGTLGRPRVPEGLPSDVPVRREY